MSFEILDGTGKGYRAGVNKFYQLESRAEVLGSLAASSFREGKAFQITSGLISINTGAFSGLLYIKNTSEDPFIIFEIQLGANQVSQWRLKRAVTTGTLVSGAIAVTPQNLNFASNFSFLGQAYKGVTGATITDGTLVASYISPVGTLDTLYNGAMLLGTNNIVALEVNPAANGICVASIIGAYIDPSLVSAL